MTSKSKILTSREFDKLFPNEEACDRYLVKNRWPKGVSCPRCGSEKAYPLKTLKFRWECPECGEGNAYRFSHLVGTIFENTKIDLKDWFKVIHLMLGAKKGISALQIQRHMGFGSYKTAWYVCHRIRTALQDKEFRKLMGIVEVDETFIGGKKGNKHKSQRGRRVGDAIKTVIVGAVERRVPYDKTIVCLANSRKISGRCIAGKEVDGTKYRGWIRPVSKREAGEISEEDRRFQDGSYPGLLDVVQISFIEPRPAGFQTENHLIDDGFYWEKVGRGGVKRVIDVRLHNTSQLAGFAKAQDLKYLLEKMAHIQYVHEPLLAPTDDMLKAYKKHKGSWDLYEKEFLDLMSRRLIENRLTPSFFDGACLLCSEDKPHHCHRRLVCEYLNDKWGGSLSVKHL